MGFSAQHKQSVDLEGLTDQRFLVLAHESARSLGWEIQQMDATGFVSSTKMTWRSWSREFEVREEDGRWWVTCSSPNAEFLDWGRNEKVVAVFLEQVNALDDRFTVEQAAECYDALKVRFGRVEAAEVRQRGALALVIPARGYIVTPIILYLNIAVFLVMAVAGVSIVQPDFASLLRFGANYRPLTLGGGWWRLISSCFVHIGLFHLLMNMYALVFVGLLLEPLLGKVRYLSAYLLCGLAASAASLAWHESTVSAGASGAIFGMYGVFLAMLTTNLIERSKRRALLQSILIFVGFNLINGLKAGIDGAGHMGGLLSGLAIGYSFVPSLRAPDDTRLRNAVIGIGTAATIAVVMLVFSRLPDDSVVYFEKVNEFARYESEALTFAPDSPIESEVTMRGLRSHVIPLWHKAYEVLGQADSLRVSPELHQKIVMMKTYCQLRVRSCELRLRMFESGSRNLEEDLSACNRQILGLVQELRARGR